MTPDEASVSGVPQKAKTATAPRRLPEREGTSTRQVVPACAETGDSSDFVFGRDKEIVELKERLWARESFVLHGSSGSGKTFLLQRVMQVLPGTLYCPDAASPQVVFQSLALALLASRDRFVRSWFRSPRAVNAKSAISLRGIVLDAVRRGTYLVVLDHLRGPAAALSADVRDLMFYGGTPVVAVARSAHMEDLGFLTPIFALRSERMRLGNFTCSQATHFAEKVARRTQLEATNLPEFIERVVDLGQGSPGAIVRMLQMALRPKYRLDGYVKTSPLYIDFRLAWHAENAL
jgi:hypothetical protein